MYVNGNVIIYNDKIKFECDVPKIIKMHENIILNNF